MPSKMRGPYVVLNKSVTMKERAELIIRILTAYLDEAPLSRSETGKNGSWEPWNLEPLIANFDGFYLIGDEVRSYARLIINETTGEVAHFAYELRQDEPHPTRPADPEFVFIGPPVLTLTFQS